MSGEAPHARPIRIALIGATGRMGRALLHCAAGFPGIVVTGAIASPSSPALGRDAGEVAGLGAANLFVTGDLPAALREADVAVDFSSPEATRANVDACRTAVRPLLICTTGFGEALEALFAAAACEIPLLVAPNTSIAVALLAELVRISARTLPPTFDIDVLELHHRFKRDAPSGTALALVRAAGERAMAPPAPLPASTAAHAGPRPDGRIGVASVRAGDLVGEHQVHFSGPGEQLCLTHRATDRAIFARGALTAALWLASQPPARYSMRDLLFAKTDT